MIMATQDSLQAWADETDLGRRLFNHNYRPLETEAAGWSLIKSVSPHADDELTEWVYLWQDAGAPQRLIRVDVAELPAWQEAQCYLAGTFEQSMRPDIPRPEGVLRAVGDVQFVASSADVDHPENIRFSRGNVAVSVSSVGRDPVDVSDLAAMIDRDLSVLRAPSTLSAAELRPLAEARHSSRQLQIAAIDPADSSWTQVLVEGGEVRRERNAIVYKPGEAGDHGPSEVHLRRHDVGDGTTIERSRRADIAPTPAEQKGSSGTEREWDASELLVLAADIVSSHVSHNQVSVADLPLLIQNVHSALSALGGEHSEPLAPPQEPAVPIGSSVKSNFIICLEDGKKLRTLKRHLMTAHGMTVDEYRAKWGLPADYPMIAPNYAGQRRALAKSIGLLRTLRSRSTAK